LVFKRSENGGGGGSRTRVLQSFHKEFYKLSSRFSFLPVMLVVNRLTPEHLLNLICLPEEQTNQPDFYDTFQHVSGEPTGKRLLLVIRQRVPYQQVHNLRCLQLRILILLLTWPRVSPTACCLYFHLQSKPKHPQLRKGH